MTVKHGLTRRERKTFIKILETSGNVAAAARAAKVGRSWLYQLRSRDPGFAEEWRDAEEAAVDLMEAEARRRAVDGIEEPLVGGGKLIKDDDGRTVVVRKYNDRLLEFLLKAHRPEKYRDKSESLASPHAPAVHIIVDADPEAAPEAGEGADD